MVKVVCPDCGCLKWKIDIVKARGGKNRVNIICQDCGHANRYLVVGEETR